jgi:ribosomal protein L11 methyltransferase
VTAWALRTNLDLEALNVHLDALEAAGLLGIVEEDGAATAYLPARVDGLPVAGRWEPVADVDWVAHGRRHARTVRIGPLVVAPPWLAAGEADPIVIDPGQAFGTGDHETTAGCLAALCELGVQGRSVIDVGTGTGVLAIAAARLGARRVVAVDTDPLAVDAARHNAGANGVLVEVRQGSADALAEPFDVVVANLDTDTLRALADVLVARLAPGGTFIASGVSLERSDEAVEAFAAAGLRVLARPGREWVVLTGRHP